MNLGPVKVMLGDARESLRILPPDSVDVICTSPPFYALRSYLKADDPAKVHELGSEPTPEAFLAALMEVFDECKRVLKPTGVCWVEFGDSYAANWSSLRPAGGGGLKEDQSRERITHTPGYSPGELMNIPHRFSEAMRSRGWRWRSTMIWEKASAMPESVNGWRWEKCKVKTVEEREFLPAEGGFAAWKGVRTDAKHEGEKPTRKGWSDCPGCDKCSATNGLILRKGQWRPTTAHSYVFMFVKSERYYCDATAASEPAKTSPHNAGYVNGEDYAQGPMDRGGNSQREDPDRVWAASGTRNPRTIIRVPNEPMDYDLCLKCGRVWRGAEKKRELRKVGKVYACTCGGAEWASHYAAFPRSLVRKLITPAISKGGCCGVCGVPYSPVVEKEQVLRYRPNEYIKREGQEGTGNCINQLVAGASSTVSAYLPSCSCPPAPSVPQTVCDPFSGTGSTLVVAAEMGLNAIGCELNKLYLPLVERRVLEILVPQGRADAAQAPEMPLFAGETL